MLAHRSVALWVASGVKNPQRGCGPVLRTVYPGQRPFRILQSEKGSVLLKWEGALRN